MKSKKAIERWLRDHYATLEIGQSICSSGIQSMTVVDLVTEGNEPVSKLADLSLSIHLFQIYCQPRTDLQDNKCPPKHGEESEDDSEGREYFRAYVTLLPHVELQGLWESLVQKLAIRLRLHYSTFQMIEVDAAALFSKFFGESSKLVSRIFDTIERKLKQEPEVFVCVLLDEIESLAAARQQSIGGNEPKDSMRALNALLVALDRLGKYSNVLVLCTSNLVQMIDPAILDRISVKQYIPEPGVKIRYEILRKCYLDLLETGMIAPLKDCQAEEDFPSSPTTILSFEDENLGPQPSQALPRYDIMQLEFRTKEQSIPYRLWKIAEKSAVGPSFAQKSLN
ncbi:MAG: hypothetical protein Q9224_001199 [Gallowayella concinna]